MPSENLNNQPIQLDIFDTKTAKISESGVQLQQQLQEIKSKMARLRSKIYVCESTKDKKCEELRGLNSYLNSISVYETDRSAEKEARYLDDEIDTLNKEIKEANEEYKKLEKESKKLEVKIARLNVKTYQSALQYAMAQKNNEK